MKLNSRATDLKICSKLFRVVLPLIQCVLRFSATSVRRQRGKVSNRKITRTFFLKISTEITSKCIPRLPSVLHLLEFDGDS